MKSELSGLVQDLPDQTWEQVTSVHVSVSGMLENYLHTAGQVKVTWKRKFLASIIEANKLPRE